MKLFSFVLSIGLPVILCVGTAAAQSSVNFGQCTVLLSTIKPYLPSNPIEYSGHYDSELGGPGVGDETGYTYSWYAIGSREGVMHIYRRSVCIRCGIKNFDENLYEVARFVIANGILSGELVKIKGNTPTVQKSTVREEFCTGTTEDGHINAGYIVCGIGSKKKGFLVRPPVEDDEFLDRSGIVTPSLKASTQLIETDGSLHSVFDICDRSSSSAWAEGAKGFGKGEWVQMDFKQPRILRTMLIHIGYGKSEQLFAANNRPRILRLTYSDDTTEVIELKDLNTLQRVQLQRGAKPTSRVRVEILDVYKGTKFDDTCISELTFE